MTNSRASDPRRVRLTHSDSPSGVETSRNACALEINGTVDAALNVIEGTEFCSGCPSCGSGRQAPIVLRRD